MGSKKKMQRGGKRREVKMKEEGMRTALRKPRAVEVVGVPRRGRRRRNLMQGFGSRVWGLGFRV